MPLDDGEMLQIGTYMYQEHGPIHVEGMLIRAARTATNQIRRSIRAVANACGVCMTGAVGAYQPGLRVLEPPWTIGNPK